MFGIKLKWGGEAGGQAAVGFRCVWCGKHYVKRWTPGGMWPKLLNTVFGKDAEEVAEAKGEYTCPDCAKRDRIVIDGDREFEDSEAA